MNEPKDDRISPPERTRQTKAPSKRAHPLTPELSHNRRKRKRAKPETLKSDPPQCLAVSNTFQFLRSWSRRRRKHSRTEQPGAGSSRRWVYSCHDSSSFRDKVVVVSYNILGVENASKHPDLYYKVPQKFMEWNKRTALICEEINRYNASVLCLQEADRFDDLDGLFRKDGFKGVYKIYSFASRKYQVSELWPSQ